MSLLDEEALDPSLKDKQQGIAQVVGTFGITVRLAAQPDQVAPQPVVHAFDGVRVRIAFDEPGSAKDVVVAGVLVGGVSD